MNNSTPTTGNTGFVRKMILGQTAPLAGVVTTLYAVPFNRQTRVLSVCACNRAAGDCLVDIWVVPAGGVMANEHLLVYQQTVTGLDTLVAELSILLEQSATLIVRASTGDASFTAFGEEEVI